MSLHTWMTPLRQSLQAAWAGRSPRERLLLGAGVWVLGLAALWMLALAPALRTWQEAPARQAQLDTQSQRKLTGNFGFTDTGRSYHQNIFG